MENPPTENFNVSNPQLVIDQQSLSFLEEIRRWANFLAIMGFIGVGLMVLLGLFMSTIMNNFGGAMSSIFPAPIFSIVYFLIALFYFIPVMYLFRFATQMKTALHQSNQEQLSSSFGNLKSLFRFMGILTIVILSLYAIVLVTAIIFSLFR